MFLNFSGVLMAEELRDPRCAGDPASRRPAATDR